MARGVADALGLEVLDTGAMYRAVTLAVLERRVDLDDGAACGDVARTVDLEVDGRASLLDGRDVTDEIRGPQVTAAVSTVSAHPEVRTVLVARQRALGRAARRGSRRGPRHRHRRVPRRAGEGLPDRERRRAGAPPPAGRGGRATRRSTVDRGRATALARRDAARLDPGRRRRCAAADDAIVIDTTDLAVGDIVTRSSTAYHARRSAGAGSVIFYRFARARRALAVQADVPRQGRRHGARAARGAYIVAPSHRSILDIPFAAYVTRRRMRFMAKERALHDPVRRLAVQRARRDRGRARRDRPRRAPPSQGALDAGEPVAIFPEGTRRTGPGVEDLLDGVAYLAMKVGVPIVPVGIGGSEDILPSGKVLPRIHKVAVVVGEPIPPPRRRRVRRRSAIAGVTAELQVALQTCFDEAQRLAGACRPGARRPRPVHEPRPREHV